MDLIRNCLHWFAPLDRNLEFLKNALAKDYPLTGPGWEKAMQNMHDLQEFFEGLGSLDDLYKTIEAYDRDLKRTARTDALLQKLVTPEAVRQGVAENRPCSYGYSQVHVLECGQAVYFGNTVACGPSCQGGSNGGPPMSCIMCDRRKNSRPYGKDLKRWHDLLRPPYMFLAREQSLVDLCGEPVYLDLRGSMILPREISRVALIRALESKLEKIVEEDIKNACTELGYDQQVTDEALRSFDTLLDCLSGFKGIPLRLAGIISIALAAKWHKKRCNEDALFGQLQVHYPDDYRVWSGNAQLLLFNRLAIKQIEEYIANAQPLNLKSYVRLPLKKTACRLWVLLNEHRIFDDGQLLQDWKAITCTCIEQALLSYHIQCKADDIAKIAGGALPVMALNMVHKKVTDFASNTNWARSLYFCRRAKSHVKEPASREVKDETSEEPILDYEIGLAHLRL
ncbi:hypothetical protein BDV96DRAFT_596609 [Lophiotrema nucula]|uniref:Uncharacterized protein n=1 Tax=Lophiotrema nucula TaxID=690887 RepID=A0A6A5ZIV6_9PLEO|nr:hypothetical protein BDV96DRAFT_596609 [Lophiotrema nucula]